MNNKNQIAIQTENLCYFYDENQTLDNINLNVSHGEFVAIIGKNGSGKSTLLKNVNGILEPNSGTIKIYGNSSDSDNYENDRKVGMIFQNPDNQIVASIVEEDIAFTLENLGVDPVEMPQRIKESLEIVGMYDYLNHATYALSGGQKQKIAIAGVLAMNPMCILLDEATSMLDPKSRNAVLFVIEELNKKFNVTIIMVTHHIEEVVLADRLIVLDNGKIVLDKTPLEVFASEIYQNLGLDYPVTIKLCRELNLNPTLDTQTLVKQIREKYHENPNI